MTFGSTGGNGQTNVRGPMDADPPSTRVAYRLAEESGRAIDDLRPLADSVDPEALDAIFDRRSADDAFVTFRHEGYTVTVTGEGDVLVDPDG